MCEVMRIMCVLKDQSGCEGNDDDFGDGLGPGVEKWSCGCMNGFREGFSLGAEN